MEKKILDVTPETAIYTKCYCEENVWKLCEAIKDSQPDELDNCYCVFISNNSRTIPLWCQGAGRGEDGLVVWDYHVILIHSKPDHEAYVYDLDTTLPFPSCFKDYFGQGIRGNDTLKKEFHRMFRVILAPEFLATFASDRSHMLTKNGEWMMPPPTYPCITTVECNNNIQDFISMDSENSYGQVMNIDNFVHKFMTST